ncbi:MAG: SpoIIE family protein phosphatase [Thermoguttaceae bacterium]
MRISTIGISSADSSKKARRRSKSELFMIHRHSLFTYLLFIILLSSSFVLGIVILGNRNLTSNMIREHQMEKFKLMTQTASDEIEIRLTSVEEVINRNARLFRDQDPHSREEATKILGQSLEAFPTIFAMEIIFADTEAEQVKEAGYAALYAYRHSQDLPASGREKQGGRDDPESVHHSYEIVDRSDVSGDYGSQWYIQPMKSGEPTWSPPYYDPQINVLMITYSVPIYDRPGHIEAIMTADVSLEWLNRLIDTFDIGKSGEPVLLTSDQIIYRSKTETDKGPHLVDFVDVIAGLESVTDTKDVKGDNFTSMFDVLKKEKAGEVRFSNPMNNEKTFLYFATLPKISWKLGCLVLEKDVMATVGRTTNLIIRLWLLGVFLLIVPSFLIARSVARPLSILTNSAQNVALGNFDEPLPTIGGTGEIPQLFSAFDTMRSNLKRYINDIAEVAAKEANMKSQLQIAHSIQQGMVPKDFESARKANLDIFAQMTPAQEVGGDLYDYQVLDDGRIYFGLGDVSGKGVPASIFMAMGKTLIHSGIQQDGNPAQVLTWVNRQLVTGNDAGLFITALCGVYDPHRHEITVSCAGHNPPLIRHANGLTEKIDITNGKFPLAIMENVEYENFTFPLPPGGVFFIYSDGVTDAADPGGNYFGEENLRKCLGLAPTDTVRALVESIMSEIKTFADGAKQSDDITILAFKETA